MLLSQTLKRATLPSGMGISITGAVLGFMFFSEGRDQRNDLNWLLSALMVWYFVGTITRLLPLASEIAFSLTAVKNAFCAEREMEKEKSTKAINEIR